MMVLREEIERVLGQYPHAYCSIDGKGYYVVPSSTDRQTILGRGRSPLGAWHDAGETLAKDGTMIFISGYRMVPGTQVIGCSIVNQVPHFICRKHGDHAPRAIFQDKQLQYDCPMCLLDTLGGEPQRAKMVACEICGAAAATEKCSECDCDICADCMNQGTCRECSELNRFGIH